MVVFTIKHRCVGYPDDTPSEFKVEANSREEAENYFWESHWDLNAMIVGVTSKSVDDGAKKLNRLVGIQSDPKYVKCKCGIYIAVKFKTCPACGREIKVTK